MRRDRRLLTRPLLFSCIVCNPDRSRIGRHVGPMCPPENGKSQPSSAEEFGHDAATSAYIPSAVIQLTKLKGSGLKTHAKNF
jgi:hypothetical protein